MGGTLATATRRWKSISKENPSLVIKVIDDNYGLCIIFGRKIEKKSRKISIEKKEKIKLKKLISRHGMHGRCETSKLFYKK